MRDRSLREIRKTLAAAGEWLVDALRPLIEGPQAPVPVPVTVRKKGQRPQR